MRSLSYVSGAGRGRVGLSGAGCSAGAAAALRGSAWSYALGARSVSSARREAREVDIEARFADPAQADRLFDVADRDMAAGTPGALECSGWSARCLLVGAEVGAVFGPYHSATLKAVLLDGVWRRPHSASFRPMQGVGSDWLDLPHDLPYDVAAPPPPSFLEVPGESGGPVRIVVYGPAVDPYVSIGPNVYKVSCAVPAGGYLTIDPLSEPKRVYVTDSQGVETDAYGKAELGGGEGSGSYVFERLPAGWHPVSWSGAFGFDLTVYEERGELPWTS